MNIMNKIDRNLVKAGDTLITALTPEKAFTYLTSMGFERREDKTWYNKTFDLYSAVYESEPLPTGEVLYIVIPIRGTQDGTNNS